MGDKITAQVRDQRAACWLWARKEHSIVPLVTVHRESTGVIVAWEWGNDGAGRSHRHVVRIIQTVARNASVSGDG